MLRVLLSGQFTQITWFSRERSVDSNVTKINIITNYEEGKEGNTGKHT